MSLKQILVTGGAGYIGSHVVRQLGEAGYDLVIYDNCSTGFPEAVLSGKLIVGDLTHLESLRQTFAAYAFTSILHFAASTVIPESVARPLHYYANNAVSTLNVLRCCQEFGVNHLVFSSTAAVYGDIAINPVAESAPTVPINPYGRSKLMSEWMIRDFGAVSPLKYVILRYFNVAGADIAGRLGQRNVEASHLIKVACEAALGKRQAVKIFGTDFPTPDGTGIRDYIHVEDLAAAHIKALDYLNAGGQSDIFNCGYGQGYSVREVIAKVQEVSGVPFPAVAEARRGGDPAWSVAASDRIRQVLGWKPQCDRLDLIIKTTLAWEKRLSDLSN